MMEFSTWVMDNLLGVFSSLTTVVLFFVYFKLNRRQKEAEVKQTEAGVKQSEGGALTTMQGAYDEFTKDYMEKWLDEKTDIDAKVLSTDSCVSLITSNPDLPGSIGDMIMMFLNK